MSAGRFRPLRPPSPIPVRTDDRGRPTAVDGIGVLQIREVWRVEDEWWRSPLSRLCFEVVLENGSRLSVYRDLARGGWYRS